ncbi:hypothetical protein C7S16_3343 [Burkholderia thailandensis]|uniref:Uncharacterized protein n=1 Tax=Burkholderia thailandensis TaxID=57975 RepID=A0AAW9D0J2_BURTH|nr:hypothetical protein [Burkholderia thailandensis]MDW9255436.1 hypothetical protein [Burkholderia thailandensis]
MDAIFAPRCRRAFVMSSYIARRARIASPKKANAAPWSECRKRGNRFQAIKKHPPSFGRRVFFRFDARRRARHGRRAA